MIPAPRRRPRREAESPWVSFADALTGLLFVFIALTFWTSWQLLRAQAEAAAEKARLTGADARAAALIGTPEDPGPFTRCLRDAPGGPIEEVAPDPATTSVALYLRDRTPWFNPCSDDLRDPLPPGADATRLAAVQRLHACVGQTILPVTAPDGEAGYRAALTFEGHTDMGRSDACPGKPGLSNWRLSGARAAAVLETFLAQSPRRADPIPAAIAARRLQIVAAGLSDTRPAWSAICREAHPWDQQVCAGMAQGGDAVSPALTAFLPGQRGYRCRGAITLEGAETRDELLRLWANACPDEATHEGRLRWLRRVDVRVELKPEIEG